MKKRKNFPLRISSELFKSLQRLADREMRSVNGQIEFLLHRAILDAKIPIEPEADDEQAGDDPADNASDNPSSSTSK